MRKTITAFALLLIVSFTFAGTEPSVTVTSPSSGNYWKNGSHSITFTVTDVDSPLDMGGNIYYSTTAGAKTDQIAEVNLFASGVCTSTSFVSGTTCTYAWTVSSSLADGNYFIVVQVNDLTNGDSNIASSASFAVDNNSPAITINQPVTGNTAYNSNNVSFDVNSYGGSPISLSSIAVSIGSNASAAFSASACTRFGNDYSCAYTEPRFDTNGTAYVVKVDAGDAAGNAAPQAQSSFTYIDGNAPAQVTGLSATSGDSQVSLSWTASSATDLNAYYIYMSTSSGFASDSNTLIGNSTSASFTKTGLSNGTAYYFRVKAGDKSGNLSAESDQSSATPSGGSNVSTPVIGSSSHPNEDKWYGSNDIDLNWGSVSGATYQYALDGNSVRTPDSNNETTSTTKAYSNLADGTYYFHLRACNGSGCGGTDHFRIRIDTTAPAPAGSLSGFGQSNGSIYLTWGAPTDASGIREYTIYRNIFQKVNNRDFVPSDSGVKKFTGITGTSYTDRNGLESGIAYYYRLQATDNAGNEGSMTAVYKVLNSGTSCSLELGSGIPEFLRGESLNATITVSGGSIKNAALRSKFPGTGLKNEQAGLQGTTINVSLQVPQDESGNGYIEIDGKDAAGNACKKQFGFKVDFEKPAVEITSPSADALVSGTIAFTVNAEDAVSGIAEVAFYADGKALAAPQKNGAVYTLQWNSESVEAGKHALMAKAKDGAGNEKTAQVEVRTEGTGSFTTKEYSYDSGKIRGLLKSAAVKDSLVASAEKLINENKPRRKLEITKSGGKYTATITVTLKNTGSAKGLQVIEVIPKSVASSARDITSEQEFTVIQNDPIIKFDLGEVAYNGEKSIAYVAGKGLTEAQARQVSAGFGSFAAPPIVLEGDVANPIEITNTNDLIFWGFIVLIGLFILLIIFVVLGGGAFLLHRHLKTRESFAAPPSLKPEIRPKRLPQENEPMRKRKWASK